MRRSATVLVEQAETWSSIYHLSIQPVLDLLIEIVH